MNGSGSSSGGSSSGSSGGMGGMFSGMGGMLGGLFGGGGNSEEAEEARRREEAEKRRREELKRMQEALQQQQETDAVFAKEQSGQSSGQGAGEAGPKIQARNRETFSGFGQDLAQALRDYQPSEEPSSSYDYSRFNSALSQYLEALRAQQLSSLAAYGDRSYESRRR